MKPRDQKIITQGKRNLQARLDRGNRPERRGPMLAGGSAHYEMSGRCGAVGAGGMVAMHMLVRKLGLDTAINERVRVFKIRNPYWESDHVLSLAYNVLSGGECIDDLERLRSNEHFMDALGAARIPDPTTAGDFLRRLEEGSIVELMETVNGVRRQVWAGQGESFLERAVLDVDATVAPTLGECKAGMDMSYKGVWGYAPLMVSLANTREPLYLVNRPGNTPSCKGAAPWIERAIDLVRAEFKTVLVRGDTDFGLSEHLDGWDEKAQFIFGFDAQPALIERAEALPAGAWEALEREPKYAVKTKPRRRPANVKEQIVRQREYKNIRLEGEEYAQFEYRPAKCAKTYRMIALRKNLSVARGEEVLFDEVLYFFYITNLRELPGREVIFEANGRCDQENLFGQFHGAMGVMRMPAGDLNSNWAYMVIAALAWTLKAWYGLRIPEPGARRAVVRMEFKRFLREYILLACQIVRGARRLVCRVLHYHPNLEIFFKMFDAIRRMGAT